MSASGSQRRRLRSSVTSFLSVPDDCLFVAFSFLDTRSIVRAARVCKVWMSVIDDRHLAWVAALFELDPLARLGPAAFLAAKRSGVGCLELARRLGGATCSLCGKRGAVFFSVGAPWDRVCDACPLLSKAPCVFLYNRFVFSRKAAHVVSTEKELRDAIDDANSSNTDDMFSHTIVVAQDIVLTSQLEIYSPLRLVGGAPTVTISHDEGPVIMAREGVLENLTLVSGISYELFDFDDDEVDHYPAVELFKGLSQHPGGLVIHNCVIQAMQGSALMCDSGRLSVSGCTIDSLCYFGLICKSTPTYSPPFLLSVRHTHFCGGSMWHISAGEDLSEADEAALLTSNVFSSLSPDSVSVTREREWGGGVIQPWRAGAMK